MKLKIRISFCLLLIMICSFSYGQMNQYNYKRELKGITEQWHKIDLPNEIIGKTLQNLSDIRVFGITKNNDTIEAPYILRLTDEKISNKEIPFKTLNSSHNSKGYYFTFEIPTEEPINQIKLQFKQQNFDWRVALEGSQNQKEWFNVIEDYRILSIKNSSTDFQFTKLEFPSSKYHFFRLRIDSKEKPELTLASVENQEIINGIYSEYQVNNINTKENKTLKQTEIDIDLQLPARVSKINIGVSNSFDYYRPITIKYLSDSFKTEQGWKYNYNILASGTLNSIEKNEFKFNSLTLQKLKILIDNQNNQPLSIDTIRIRGYLTELIARFTEPATYFLTYGNTKAVRPKYDIEQFTNKIPGTLQTLELGNEMIIGKDAKLIIEPLFKNKIWLWGIMSIIILILGWFSLKMLRKG